MTRAPLFPRLRRFRDDTSGSVTVEAVIALPIMLWVLMASFVFFDLYRFDSVRDKATYTLADMVSRETTPIDAAYVTNAKTLMDFITGDAGTNQLRISVISYDSTSGEYAVEWSQVRGTGRMGALTSADTADKFTDLPVMVNGEQLIMIETEAVYSTPFNIGISGTETRTRVFTRPRFAPQICWEACA